MGRAMKIGRILGAAIAAVIAGGAATAASADVLYDNIPGFPGVAPTDLYYCSSCGQGLFQVYQPFSLSGSSTITHTDFAITDIPGSTVDLTAHDQTIVVSFWNSALDTRVASETITSSGYTLDATPSANGLNYAIIGADLAPVGLAAGDYYVSYHSEDMTIPGWTFGQQSYVQTFGVSDSNPGGSLDVPGSDLDPFPQNQHGAFDIIGHAGLPAGGGGVPEPAAWALMLTGFGLAGAALRRRKAAFAA